MAGPTPVSALIHAATMVTAGVYLIARTHELYALAPPVLTAVAVIGAATLLLAGCSALVQRDIKRILAYSTISQIGYMFLALGIGAWSAAIFHFMTHAFFKALLFLAAGVVILSLHHEHDIFRMGGLRQALPLVFWTFLIGAGSLAGLPLVTAGFYSKDWILWEAWSSGKPWLWAAGALGAGLTALYSFRVVFRVFFGERRAEVRLRPSPALVIPLAILAVFSVIAGFLEIPRTLGDVTVFRRFTEAALPVQEAPTEMATEFWVQFSGAAMVLIGIALAYVCFLRRPDFVAVLSRTRWGAPLSRFWFEGWAFDRLYGALFVGPLVRAARANQIDLVDGLYRGIAWVSRSIHDLVARTQTGQLRWYASVLVTGAVLILTLALWGKG
jgi:NADH-quinone oxidoreductase subunit L